MCRPNVRFCLICNYISKIDESLQDEFVCVRFNQLPKKEIYRFIQNITELEGIEITRDEIETIQTNYHSDIRSMINFIQLNSATGVALSSSASNVKEEKRIISSENWEKIHTLLFMDDRTPDTNVDAYIHKLSIIHNMDKRNILNTYLNYVIQNYPDLISHEFLNIVENTVHTTDDVPIKSIMYYFCTNLSEYYHSRISA